MVEGLVIIRDFILAILLSWIGVDYQPEKNESVAAPASIVYETRDREAPLRMIAEKQTVKLAFECENRLIAS